MNIQINDGEIKCNIVGVELCQSGIWPILKVTVCVRGRLNKQDYDIYEVTVNKQSMAFGVVKNNVTICGDYYPDAGKEKNTLPEDIFQQVLLVIRRF